MNAKVVSEEIQSMVNENKVVIVIGDIRATFDLLIIEGVHPYCSRHTFNELKF